MNIKKIITDAIDRAKKESQSSIRKRSNALFSTNEQPRAATNDAVILANLKAQGVDPSTDDLLFFKKNKCLESAHDAITRMMIDGRYTKTPLADIETSDGGTIEDLPSLVATAISKPYGSLGLDTSKQWGSTTSTWYLFQHQAEDFLRGKIDKCRMRKLGTAADRLYLALGCLQWAGIIGVHDVPQFQSAFTSALIFDKDATAELNGETIDVSPIDTDAPIGNAGIMQILDILKSQGLEISKTKEYARQAAAKNKKQLTDKAEGGKNGARTRKDRTSPDPVHISLERWIKSKMKEWDDICPERKKRGYKGHYSNAQIFRDAERSPNNRNANNEPIFTAEQIKEWFKPSKIKRRGGRVK